MPSPDRDPLEELLDGAGREVQPGVPGWQTLPLRLAQTPRLPANPLGRWGTVPIGAAVVAACLLVVFYPVLHRQALQAQEGPIEVRRQGVDLTVLSVAHADQETLYMPVLDLQQARPAGKQLRGQALVKDRRLLLNLKAGDNVVRFTDIAATIDPTSVRFESLTDPAGTTVVEQSFEYDLATADALLKRFMGREIVCVDRMGQEIGGILASHDNATIVLAKVAEGTKLSTENVSRQALAAVRLPEMPADLIVKPTLVWKLRTKTPGKHETQLSYICGFVKWQANYVIEVAPGGPGQPDLLDVNGCATLENTSGTAFPQAGLRLIAGDVRRVQDPWVKIADFPYVTGSISTTVTAGTLPSVAVFGFQEQSLFEYHLYSLNTPCTVADHQIKQLTLLKKKGVKATRRYVFDPFEEGPRQLAIELVVKNEKENELGLPLPKGSVTVQQRGSDGELAVVGQTEIDHTAVKEELKVRYGHAFDVVGEFRLVLVDSTRENMRLNCETRIRNHKQVPIQVRCYARQDNEAVLVNASLPYHVESTDKIYFEFTLAANAEQVIRYTVVRRSEK